MSGTLGNNELHNLPSKLMYANFNGKVENCESCPFYDKALSRLQKEDWNVNVSSNILNALCYVYNENLINKIDESTCNYLYYWLNYTIYNNIEFQLHSTLVLDVLNFLLQSNDGQNICNYNKYNVHKDNYRDIKLLFDFSKDYDKLNDYFNIGHRICNIHFSEYLNGYISKYNEYRDMCKKKERDSETCSAFYNYFSGKTELNLSNWKCTLVGSSRISATKEAKHAGFDEQKDQRVNTVYAHTIVYRDNHGKMPHQYVDHREHKNEDILHINHEQSNDTALENKSTELSAIKDISDSSSSSTSKSIVIPSLAIGISIFSIILCKFTPVGYWLKKAVLGKSKRKRNIIMDRNIIEDDTIPDVLCSPRRFNVRYSNI